MNLSFSKKSYFSISGWVLFQVGLLLLLSSTTTNTVTVVNACTNVLITPAASANGNPIIAYNADSGSLQGMLYHYPATNHSSSEPSSSSSSLMRKVYNWDTGVYLGEIPEVPITYNVVGNTNEHGLVIAETTFGGVDILSNPQYMQKHGKLDYGSLIYITLQRAKTATEAIDTMTSLMDTYGYVSEGESFSIADRGGNVWMMEVISRGQHKTGAVWVAVRIPNGMIAAHSNQARIQTFPRKDPENCRYAHDVITLAKELDLYQSVEDDPDDTFFSFSDVYNPVTFMGARASDARTWSILSTLAKDPSFEKTYEDYALGQNLQNRMPLYVEPKESLISFENVMSAMSNHYEHTALDFRNDLGGGQYKAPYRPRPLTWKYNDKSYHNERAVATQQTGWNFIAEIRMDKPPPISSLLWFAVDDSSTSPRYPVYGCSRNVSEAYSGKGTQDGVPSPLLSFDISKAFWVQNMVSNFVYSRWEDAYPYLQTKLATVHEHFEEEIEVIDEQLMAVYDPNDLDWVVDHATAFSVKAGDWMHKEWMEFYGQLFARYRDFFTIEEDEKDPVCNCKVKEVGFSDAWKEKIVKETGEHYECLDEDSVPDFMMIGIDNGEDKKEEEGERKDTNSLLRGSGSHKVSKD